MSILCYSGLNKMINIYTYSKMMDQQINELNQVLQTIVVT